jgi:hypothetical protein
MVAAVPGGRAGQFDDTMHRSSKHDRERGLHDGDTIKGNYQPHGQRSTGPPIGWRRDNDKRWQNDQQVLQRGYEYQRRGI